MKIYKYMMLALAVLLSAGCVEEQFEVDPDKIPLASELDVVTVVDPETNEVTLSITNQGMVPIWSVENDAVNGKVVTKDYVGNGMKLVFNEKGEHTINVKAYNAHGVSLGAKPVTFETLSYILYNKGLPGWDPGEDSNLWIEADKTKITHYYAPGWAQITEGPKVEVNGGDHTLTFAQATTDQWQAQFAFTEIGISTSAGKKYDFQVVLNSNVALPGVTIKLTQADDDNVFYFADRHEVPAGKDWVYQVADFEGKDINDLDLFFDFGGNPENTVVDIKQIILCEHQDHHVVDDAGGDVAVKWDASIEANMWPPVNPTVEHWFSPAGWGGMETPAGTFTDNGDKTYTIVMPEGMGPDQWQGQTHFKNTGISTSSDKKYDFQVVLLSSEDHPGVTVKISKQGADDVFYCEGRHALKANKEFIYQLSNVRGKDIETIQFTIDVAGGAAGSSLVVSDIIICEHQSGHTVPAVEWTAAEGENLWVLENPTIEHWFSPAGWGGMETPAGTFTDNGDKTYTIVMPEGMGPDQWQGQTHFKNTGVSTTADKLYDFQVVLLSSEDHPGVTVKLSKQGDDEKTFYCDGRHALKANKPFIYQFEAYDGIDIETVQLSIDVAGGVAGSTLTISNIILRESK